MSQKKSPSLFQRIKDAFTTKTDKQTDESTSQALSFDQPDDAYDATTDAPATHVSQLSPLDDTPITAPDIERLLAQLDYKFTYHAPKVDKDKPHDESPTPIHHFTMQISDENHSWGCMVRYFETQQLLAVYSILPFRVAESHRASMVVALTQLNYDLVIGNLELDLSDGELRFKTSLDIEVTGLNENVLSYLLNSNFAMTSRLHDTLAQLNQQDTPAVTLTEAFEQAVYLEQETAFYLASDSRH